MTLLPNVPRPGEIDTIGEIVFDRLSDLALRHDSRGWVLSEDEVVKRTNEVAPSSIGEERISAIAGDVYKRLDALRPTF